MPSSNPDDSLPVFATMREWMKISGCTRSVTYNELGRGKFRAIKRGRSLLLDVRFNLAVLRAQPAAVIKPPAVDLRPCAKQPESDSIPVKRPVGRPRKHPLKEPRAEA